MSDSEYLKTQAWPNALSLSTDLLLKYEQLKQKPRERDREMTLGLINANPIVHAKRERVARATVEDFNAEDAVDALDVFDILFDSQLPLF
ncbi:hypothetical protein QJS10_CPA02g01133 [Acorus calamus]|uniref:Uncharacterized protein n=1 Tax=Acorus calamus TaxID=4465 RepID=A0AAV9FH82_ACOCL|nr:hypothetical protein QJS10_CPA02g01133 [Acorus calamus]